MLSIIDFEKRLFRGFGSNQFLVSFCNLLKERNPDNDYKLQKECYPYGRRSLDNLLHHIIYLRFTTIERTLSRAYVELN